MCLDIIPNQILDILSTVFHGFPQSFQERAGIVSQLGHGYFLPDPFPILLFDAIYSKILIASLYKSQKNSLSVVSCHHLNKECILGEFPETCFSFVMIGFEYAV
jgi:hypothetical protein